MEFMQLEMFVAVVEERSVLKAARRVGRTQPAVTIAMRRLEQEIGAPVLDRSRPRDYRPTELGIFLYEQASLILGLRKDFLAVALGERKSDLVSLNLGTAGQTVLRRVSRLIERFQSRYPHVRVSIHSHSVEVCFEELTKRELDLAFLDRVPNRKRQDGDILLTRISGVSRQGDFWIAVRRSGRSSCARAFEEMLVAPVGRQSTRGKPKSETISSNQSRSREILSVGSPFFKKGLRNCLTLL